MYATLLLLLTIAISFFVSSNLYSTYATSSEEKTGLNSKIESLKLELDSLNKKREQVKNDKDTKALIAQFASDYREDLILNQIYAKFD
jgi:cell division protein FtsB